MTFEEAVEHILRHEGGYSNDVHDPGGETNFGISKRAYPMLEIKSLNRAAAAAIYRRDYWLKVGIEKLPACLRLIVFDSAVNQGPKTAVTLLQCVVDVKQDGVIGPQTLAAITSMKPEKVLSRYAKMRLNSYFRNKNFQRFGEGWVTRLLDVSIASKA